jgi:hypothetical protein
MGLGKVRRANADSIISHWCHLIDNLKASPLEFYHRLHEVIRERQIPNLEEGRIDWREGGPLSPKRQYWRLLRERITIDICAAPFGTGFFVSWRLGQLRLRLNVLGLLILLVGLASAASAIYEKYRFEFWIHPEYLYWTIGIPSAMAVLLLFIMRGAVGAGLADFDALLLHTPIVAGFYERFLRPITYYRIDVAMMYEEAVHRAVMQVIDELADAQKLPRLSEAQRKPILRDFYKR